MQPNPELAQLPLPSVKCLDISTSLSDSKHTVAPAQQNTTLGSGGIPAEAVPQATQDTAHRLRPAHHTTGKLQDHNVTKNTGAELLVAEVQSACDKLSVTQHDPNHHLEAIVAAAIITTTVHAKAIQQSPRESISPRHNAVSSHDWPISKDSNMEHHGLGTHMHPISPEEDSSNPHPPQPRVTTKVPLKASVGPVGDLKEAQTGPLTPFKSAENARPAQRNLSRLVFQQ